METATLYSLDRSSSDKFVIPSFRFTYYLLVTLRHNFCSGIEILVSDLLLIAGNLPSSSHAFTFPIL